MEEKMFQLNLTEEECQELQRTLMGRLDLDIAPKLKEAMAEGAESGDTTRVLQFQHLKDVNQKIFVKLLDLGFKSIF